MEFEPLKPGIYFGLASDIYHKDRALSRTNLLDMLDTPNTFWVNSWMNPQRKEKKKTDAMNYGSAFDCLLFTPEKFTEKFQIVPIDPWSASKIKIQQDEYYAIIESIKVLRGTKESRLWLSNGYPHVTIVFEWNGLLFRCEHDYFMARGSTDYKAVYSLHDFHLQKSFRQYGLDIQMALYKKSRARFKEQFRAGEAKVYGDVTPEFFSAFMNAEMNEFMFIFQRDATPFPFRSIFPEDDTEESGLNKIDAAIEVFHTNMRRHGEATPWPICTGEPELFSMFYGSRKS